MADTDFDVIIVGAGLAGAALAARLAELPLRTALLEAARLPSGWPPVEEGVGGYDARVSALTAASQRLLDGLGVWGEIARRRVCAYTDMHVWDAEGTGSIHFDAEEVGQPCLGHIVENRLINAALLEKLRFSRNITLLDASPAARLQSSARGVELELENGDALAAPLVVAADGANSRIREWAGFVTREWEYGQKAIVTTVRTEHSHENTAWQRFLPQGPLAFLPLADAGDSRRYCSIVWSAEVEMAERLLMLADDEFRAELGSAFEHRLGEVAEASRRFGFPLRQRHATRYVQPGIALVGDAAHTIHPLAGQGINLGFRDVQVLSEELERACRRGIPLGDPAVLSRYQRRRKGDNLGMMLTMEGFKQLFGQRALPLRWLRNTGMRLVDRAGPVKRQIIRQAMGLE